ncbi:MAG: hypothetical protein WC718_01355 [Phycisphaerales bacterium]|jgi:hypothetical protein
MESAREELIRKTWKAQRNDIIREWPPRYPRWTVMPARDPIASLAGYMSAPDTSSPISDTLTFEARRVERSIGREPFSRTGELFEQIECEGVVVERYPLPTKRHTAP